MKYYSGWERWQIVPDYSPEEQAYDEGRPTIEIIADDPPF